MKLDEAAHEAARELRSSVRATPPAFEDLAARRHRNRVTRLSVAVVLVAIAIVVPAMMIRGGDSRPSVSTSSAEDGSPVAQLNVVGEPTLGFDRSEYTIPRPGLVEVTFSGTDGLTLTFEEFPDFVLGPTPNEPLVGTLELAPGTYHLTSAIPGHTDAGFRSTVTVGSGRSACFDDPGPNTASDGTTFGPVTAPDSGSAVDTSALPDFIPVACPRADGIGGYVRRDDLFPRGFMAESVDVYSTDGTTIVGHLIQGKGFVALDEDPADIPNVTTTTAIATSAPAATATRQWIIPIGAPDDVDPPSTSGNGASPPPRLTSPVEGGPVATRLAELVAPILPGATLGRASDAQLNGETLTGSVQFAYPDGSTLTASVSRYDEPIRLRWIVHSDDPGANSALSRLQTGTEIVALDRSLTRSVIIVRASGISLTLQTATNFSAGLDQPRASTIALEDLTQLAQALDTSALDDVMDP